MSESLPGIIPASSKAVNYTKGSKPDLSHWHGMLYCASIVFFSRPESGVICMTDGDFVRVVGDKERRKEDERNL